MENQQDRDRIAEEAVGQRHGSAPPDDLRERESMSPEEASRRFAWSVGPEASVSEKTAESVGERVGDAYSEPGSTIQTRERRPALQASTATESLSAGIIRPVLATRRRLGEIVSRRFGEWSFIMTVAGFAMGYMTGVLLHSRISDQLGMTRGPFQITTPPQGSRHPRGFVQSAVLKTITEHPQGMTAAEIIEELEPGNIDPHSIDYALGVLLRAKKVGLQEGGSKYISTAAEVPTAPDQPS